LRGSKGKILPVAGLLLPAALYQSALEQHLPSADVQDVA
jgi:hypothetical protein